jgi:hypothetical protein
MHVHDLWVSKKHNEITHRTFALPDIKNFKPFYMMGVSACLDYIKNWRITQEDTELLCGLESLAELPAAFWSYALRLSMYVETATSRPVSTTF